MYSYDYANRLIQEERVYRDGDGQPCLFNAYFYDYMGNRVASTDKYGNTTKHVYDEFGGLTEKKYPEILYVDGMIKSPTTKVLYDFMNNPSTRIDTNGQKN